MVSHYVFSYGTLQNKTIQLELYGTLLQGQPDILKGFKLNSIMLKNNLGENKMYPIIEYTGNPNETIKGFVFKMSHTQLSATDIYEGPSYKRISTITELGRTCWVYAAH